MIKQNSIFIFLVSLLPLLGLILSISEYDWRSGNNNETLLISSFFMTIICIIVHLFLFVKRLKKRNKENDRNASVGVYLSAFYLLSVSTPFLILGFNMPSRNIGVLFYLFLMITTIILLAGINTIMMDIKKKVNISKSHNENKIEFNNKNTPNIKSKNHPILLLSLSFFIYLLFIGYRTLKITYSSKFEIFLLSFFYIGTLICLVLNLFYLIKSIYYRFVLNQIQFSKFIYIYSIYPVFFFLIYCLLFTCNINYILYLTLFIFTILIIVTWKKGRNN